MELSGNKNSNHFPTISREQLLLPRPISLDRNPKGSVETLHTCSQHRSKRNRRLWSFRHLKEKFNNEINQYATLNIFSSKSNGR